MKTIVSLLVFVVAVSSSSLAHTKETDGNLTKEDWVKLVDYFHPDTSDKIHGHENIILSLGRGNLGGENFFWALYTDKDGVLHWKFSKPMNMIVLSNKLWVQKFCTQPSGACDRWTATDDAVQQILDSNHTKKLEMEVIIYR